MMRAAGRILRSDLEGVRWHARAWNLAARGGPTPPAVLVPGPGAPTRLLRPLARSLARAMPVVVLEAPGFDRAVDANDFADALLAWTASAGFDRCTLVGHALGCAVAVALADRHPHLVDRLALVTPVPRDAPWWLSVVGSMDAHPFRARETARRLLEDPADARLLRVRCPTLVVGGGRDDGASQSWAQHLADAAPGGALARLPRVSMMMMPEGSARAVARELLPFLCAPRARIAPYLRRPLRS